jgi:uncharacterized protein YjbI with pentapeptide repeats
VIVTFYSYKGGVGRSMALANVGEILADIGYDVTLCDFDLEAPGLERYVSDAPARVAELRSRPGVVDLLEEYKDLLANPEGPQTGPAGPAGHFKDMNGLPLRRPSSYAAALTSHNPGRLGRLRFLGAGARDEARTVSYSESVRGFDWPDFYDRWAGAAYLDFFREDLTTGQAIVLVDSRTGVTEHGGVCTHHLADLVVLMSAPNDLNIEGTRWMADLLATADLAALRRGRPLQVLPVAGRVEIVSQGEELAEFRTRFKAEFAATVPAAAGDGETFVEDSEIPYIPYFAFTEKVVARQADTDARQRELYRAYEALSRAIVNVGLQAGMLARPKRDEWASAAQLDQAERSLKRILSRHRLWLESGRESGERAVLSRRDLSRQDMVDVDLSEADLTEANLEQADMRRARLVGATLSGAVLRGAKLDDADLSGANLRGAILTGAVLPDAVLDFSDLDQADLEAADASGATWRGATLVGTRLNRAKLYDCNMTEADLSEAALLGTDLRSADLTGVTGLEASELARAILDDATQLPAGVKPGAPFSADSPSASWRKTEIVPLSAQRSHPALSEDFRFLDQRLLPEFRDLTARAERTASRLRLWHAAVLALAIIGVLFAAGIGYTIVADQPYQAPGLAWNAVVPLGIAAVASATMLLPAYRRLSGSRVSLQRAATRLRAEYFLYLGRIGVYADPGQRRNTLEQQISAIAQEDVMP